MTCDRALLSAYVDNELDPAQRFDLERHLDVCPDCTQELETFQDVRLQLRDLPRGRAPSELGTQLQDRIRRKKRASLRWLPVAVGAPLGLIGVLAGASLLAPRFEAPAPLVVTATAPATGAQRVSLTSPIELWFDREIQSQSLPEVSVEPRIPVRVAVDGNALRIEPTGSLTPGQTYTIAVSAVTDVAGRKLKAPAVVSFTTAPATLAEIPPELGSPRADALNDGPRRTATESASQGGSEQDVNGTIARADSLSSRQTPKWPSARAGLTVKAVEPREAILPLDDALGARTSPGQSIQVVEQAFQGGMMLKVGASAQTLVLQRVQNRWESYADPARLGEMQAMSDTSLPPPPGALAPAGSFGRLWNSSTDLRTRLGWAVYELRLNEGVVEQRERGTAVILGHMAYLLQSDGRWSVLSIGR